MDPAVNSAITGYLKFHLISIGVKNGVFEHLKDFLNCKELSAKSKCDERYLVEWCQAMTLGGIIESADNPSGMQFRVRADALAAIQKSEPMFKLLKSVAEPIDKITETFKTGERMDYNDYKNVAAIIENLLADFYEHHLCKVIASNELLKPLNSALEMAGSRVMDFGCGCGRSTVALAKHFTQCSVIGYDIDELSIERANANKGTGKCAICLPGCL